MKLGLLPIAVAMTAGCAYGTGWIGDDDELTLAPHPGPTVDFHADASSSAFVDAQPPPGDPPSDPSWCGTPDQQPCPGTPPKTGHSTVPQ